jgi:hypothetical protein
MTKTSTRYAIIATVAAAFIPSVCLSQEVVTGPPKSNPDAGLSVPLWTPGKAPASGTTLIFRSVPKHFGKAHIQLSGGGPAINANEWRAVAIAANATGENCTMTLVGPAVALVAAHCVDAGLLPSATGLGTISASVIFKTKTYGLTCEMAPAYRQSDLNPTGAPRDSDDFALCDLSSRTNELDAEVLSINIEIIPNSMVQMMGYGCTHLGLSEDNRYTYQAANGTLNMGPEAVETVNVSIYPDKSGNYLRTRSKNSKDPVLCYGDSGGPVIVAAPAGPGRRIVAVNSAVGATMEATHANPTFYSYLSPLASPGFRTFMADWVKQSGVPEKDKKDRKICGFNLEAQRPGCRK